MDARLQVRFHQSRVEGQNHLPRPADHTSLDAAQDMVGLLGCERTLLGHIQLLINQHPQVLLSRAALNPFIPQPVLISGVGPTQVWDLVLGLVLFNLTRFTQAHFLSLSRSLWMASHPSGTLTAPLSLVSSGNLLRVHSISLSMPLMKILNSTGPHKGS